MTWDLYEGLAALAHAPMLVPVALAPALIWAQWAWPRLPRPGLALQGLGLSLAWSLLLAYLWRQGWGAQAAWGYWAPLFAGPGPLVGAGLGAAALVWRERAYRAAPSRRKHLELQVVWGSLWYLAFVLGGR